MTVIAVAMVFIFFAWVFKKYWWLMMKTKRDGIETDASVCRIEQETMKMYRSAEKYPVSLYYVVFQGRNGLTTEARLLNPVKSLMVGDRIRIRYLEEKNDSAVLTESAGT